MNQRKVSFSIIASLIFMEERPGQFLDSVMCLKERNNVAVSSSWMWKDKMFSSKNRRQSSGMSWSYSNP